MNVNWFYILSRKLKWNDVNFQECALFSFLGIPGSDYINANYIDGYRKQNAYIATQGALPETFGDFWRMMWEQRGATVVMMTKLEERSRVRYLHICVFSSALWNGVYLKLSLKCEDSMLFPVSVRLHCTTI